MFLGLILSFLVHGIIEILYINNFLGKGITLEQSLVSHNCYLPLSLQVILPIVGIFGGYLFGCLLWQKLTKK